ncbi:MAG: transposase [Polyangiaceae bacterium]|nr:transposase [Polyangiaceae bacterium]
MRAREATFAGSSVRPQRDDHDDRRAERRDGPRVHAICKRRTRANFLAFLDRVIADYPKGDVYIVVDNLNIHTGPEITAWCARYRGRIRFVYTPRHASWLNQIEIWFSILQRRVLRYGCFADVKELEHRLKTFVRYYNRFEAKPFPLALPRRVPRPTVRPDKLMALAAERNSVLLVWCRSRRVREYYRDAARARLHEQGPSPTCASRRATSRRSTRVPTTTPWPCARLRRDTVHLWILEIADHKGRWAPPTCVGSWTTSSTASSTSSGGSWRRSPSCHYELRGRGTSHCNRCSGSAMATPPAGSARLLAPRWRMTPIPALARRLVVAKYSEVRKLGAFHLMPSAINGSTWRPRAPLLRHRDTSGRRVTRAARRKSTSAAGQVYPGLGGQILTSGLT